MYHILPSLLGLYQPLYQLSLHSTNNFSNEQHSVKEFFATKIIKVKVYTNLYFTSRG